MTHKPLWSSVVRKRYVATAASHNVPAVAALYYTGSASAIDKQDSLVALGDGLLQGILQGAAEDASVPLSQLLSHVHYLDLRHSTGPWLPL